MYSRYGQWMPPMIGGIFYEHGHRMVATAVGFLTVVLGFLGRVKWEVGGGGEPPRPSS